MRSQYKELQDIRERDHAHNMVLIVYYYKSMYLDFGIDGKERWVDCTPDPTPLLLCKKCSTLGHQAILFMRSCEHTIRGYKQGCIELHCGCRRPFQVDAPLIRGYVLEHWPTCSNN